MDILNTQLLDNPLQDWGIAILILMLTFLGALLLKRVLMRRISRAPMGDGKGLDRLAKTLVKGTHNIFIFILALYLGSLVLSLPESVELALGKLIFVTTILQLTLWASKLVDIFIEERIEARPEHAADIATTMGALSLVAKIILW